MDERSPRIDRTPVETFGVVFPNTPRQKGTGHYLAHLESANGPAKEEEDRTSGRYSETISNPFGLEIAQ